MSEANSVGKSEEEILAFWRENHVFQKSIEERKGAPLFSTNDGPPFATGLPHYGHLLASTIKDAILRYKTMQGFCVPRRFGWDCHGLPVENEVEKEKGLSDPGALAKYGIARFNEECRAIVMRYSEEWKTTIERLGRWVDFTENYQTMDKNFMESVWWTFKQLFEKGYVYEGYKVMPFSPKLGTPLSNFEATSNYKEVDDPSVFIRFKMGEKSLLVWTTTPWTLPTNMALAVGPDIDYVRVEFEGEQLVLAKERFEAVLKEGVILEEFKGKELIGKEYEPLFDYFKEEGAFRVIGGDFVTTSDGTGIVHVSPAHGEDDFYAAKKEGIPSLSAVDNYGVFTKLTPDLEGLFFKEADKPVLAKLKEKGLLFRRATLRHRYPFCWRTDAPLMYKAHATWFIGVEKFKTDILRSAAEINWVPEHIKAGRFGKWLEGARDWAVSRNRFWGTPIPIWKSESGEILVIGSCEELEEKTGEKVDDIHRHFIDQLEIRVGDEVYRRVPEIFDCWFESGSAPWAQWHYPFENKELFEGRFPADFIAEGLDQTRGWFYTLSVLAAGIFDKPSFKNVIVNGIILAEDGNKMSKRLKNYPDPSGVIDMYGADALRLYLLASPATRGDDLRFCERGVQTVARQVLIPLTNAFGFYQTYAKIYSMDPKEEEGGRTLIDRWILSRTETLCKRIEESLDRYILSDGVEDLIAFVDELTNWYIRRSRSRFWSEEESVERTSAFATLKSILLSVARAAAPFIPFLTEKIWQGLGGDKLSVHLADFPRKRDGIDEKLESEMAAAQQIVRLGHSLRKEQKIRVRQPLGKAWVVAEGIEPYLDLISDELNVKEVVVARDAKEFVEVQIKPNFRVVGKKVGGAMRAVASALQNLSDEAIESFLRDKKISVEGFILGEEDIEIVHQAKGDLVAKADGKVSVAFDTELSGELIEEGLAREIVNKINTMRRDAHFEVSDRIKVVIETTDCVRSAFEKYADYVRGETLATEVLFEKVAGQEWELGSEKAKIEIERVSHV